MIRKYFAHMACCAAASLMLLGSANADPVSFARSAAEADSAALSLVYDPDTGSLDIYAPTGADLTAIELRSTDLFAPAGCENLSGAFDVCTTDKIFKLDSGGFGSTSFGAVLATDLTVDDLMQGIVVDGATLGGGFDTGTGPVIVHSALAIPEPVSVSMLLLGVAMIIPAVRSRR